MPIAVEAMAASDYEVWLSEAREEYARTNDTIKVADSSVLAVQNSHSE